MKDDDIVWLAFYDVNTDVVMALPISRFSPSFDQITNCKMYPRLTKKEADEMNARLLDNPHDRSRLDRMLTGRWEAIARQRREASA